MMSASFQFCTSENVVATASYPRITKLLLSLLIYAQVAQGQNQQPPEAPSSLKAIVST